MLGAGASGDCNGHVGVPSAHLTALPRLAPGAAACYCNSTFKHGRIPAEPHMPPGTPPTRRGRPIAHMCRRSSPGSWGDVAPDLLYGADGWCEVRATAHAAPGLGEACLLAAPMHTQPRNHPCCCSACLLPGCSPTPPSITAPASWCVGDVLLVWQGSRAPAPTLQALPCLPCCCAGSLPTTLTLVPG